MDIRKEKLDLYKVVYNALRPRLSEILSEEQAQILYLYLGENKGLQKVAEIMHFADYHIVKEELKEIKLRNSALC